jgi:hypothetical protein
MSACIPAMKAIGLFLALAGPFSLAGAQGFRYWNVADTTKAPETLSATGAYVSITGKQKTLQPNAWHFEVNSALWSDDAKKKRWVLLKPGKSIGYREKDDYWDYPDSTVFIKNFAIDTITGDSTSRVLWETRLLINAKEPLEEGSKTLTDHWYGFTYKWNADQKDARLVHAEYMGKPDSIRIWPQGKGMPSRWKKWSFPSRDQCDRCHRSNVGGDSLHARSVLGFFTAQLNRPHPDSAGINQLEYFFVKKVLTGTRSDWNAPATPRWYGIEDSTAPAATLDVRARSYIAANCSGCHGKRGNAIGAADMCYLDYDFHAMTPQMEFRHHYTRSFNLEDTSITPTYYPKTDRGNNPDGLDSLFIEPALLVPGYPQKSTLFYRQRARRTEPGNYDLDRDQMPPIASYEVNERAMAVLERWIREIPSRPAPNGIVAPRRAGMLPAATLRGSRLVLSHEALRSHPKVTMVSVSGREVGLRRIAEGIYQVPDGLPKGLYFIRIGAQSLLKYLL